MFLVNNEKMRLSLYITVLQEVTSKSEAILAFLLYIPVVSIGFFLSIFARYRTMEFKTRPEKGTKTVLFSKQINHHLLPHSSWPLHLGS